MATKVSASNKESGQTSPRRTQKYRTRRTTYEKSFIFEHFKGIQYKNIVLSVILNIIRRINYL